MVASCVGGMYYGMSTVSSVHRRITDSPKRTRGKKSINVLDEVLVDLSKEPEQAQHRQ